MVSEIAENEKCSRKNKKKQTFLEAALPENNYIRGEPGQRKARN